MKELWYQYHLEILFSEPARDHRFTVKSIPHSDERQEIIDQKIKIVPNEFLCDSRDSFGNLCIYGNSKGWYEKFEVLVEGMAKTGLKQYVTETTTEKIGVFKYPSAYTKPGLRLRQFFDSFHFDETSGVLQRVMMMMEKLYLVFPYQKGITNILTTAEEAMEKGGGVCQDYAHILIALCHMAGIPARYVVGMMVGEGASHAWVEVFFQGKWYGFDPTNRLLVEDQHIKISYGRDYRDCVLNQGVFIGGGTQTQTICVKVEER